MRVHVTFELSADDRRRLRARLGRGGLATRSEVRVIATHAVRDAITTAPMPKTRAKQLKVEMATAQQRSNDLIPPDTACARCGKPKADHRGRKLDCPLGRSIKPGSTFVLPAAVAS